ncbi:MAG: hypothetical protein COB09_18705 [Thalassobium sp.]|nr:MAG: hypothetical protein COB09_18705 [Thalassobium sp.]
MSIKSRNAVITKILYECQFNVGKAKFVNVQRCRSPFQFFATAKYGREGQKLDKPRVMLFTVEITNIVGRSNDIVKSVLVFERHEKVNFDNDDNTNSANT